MPNESKEDEQGSNRIATAEAVIMSAKGRATAEEHAQAPVPRAGQNKRRGGGGNRVGSFPRCCPATGRRGTPCHPSPFERKITLAQAGGGDFFRRRRTGVQWQQPKQFGKELRIVAPSCCRPLFLALPPPPPPLTTPRSRRLLLLAMALRPPAPVTTKKKREAITALLAQQR